MTFRAHSTLYFATGIVFIALETFGIIWPAIVVKGLIIPLLIWLYASHIRDSIDRFHRVIITAQYLIAIGCLKQYDIKFRKTVHTDIKGKNP